LFVNDVIHPGEMKIKAITSGVFGVLKLPPKENVKNNDVHFNN